MVLGVDVLDLLEGLKLYEKDFRLRLEINDIARGWQEVYPRLNIREQLVFSHNWILANKDKAPKTRLLRFLNSWMRRADEYARSSPVYTEKFKRVEVLAPPPDLTQDDADDLHRQAVKALGPAYCKESVCRVCGKP